MEEEKRKQQGANTQEFMEVLDDSEIIDLFAPAEIGTEPQVNVKVSDPYRASRQKQLGRQRTVVLVLSLILGVAKAAAVIFIIWILTTQIGFVASYADDTADKTASSGIISFQGNVISSELQRKLSNIKTRIDYYFLFDTEVDYETGILKGYVDSFNDPYTVYYTPDEYKDLMESTSGRFSGIGVVVQQNTNGMVTVVRPYVDAPGYNAGIRTDDIIYKVNGEEVSGQDLSLVVSKIKGEAGTTVDIQIYRPSTNEYIDMTIERAEIEIETISHEMLVNNIGYISMTSFDEVTYTQFMAAYEELQANGMQALIIDLRDNGGGLLDICTSILDKLLPEGVLTYTENKAGTREYYRSDANAILDIPVVILVNGYSASASEIFTGAMKDYDAATIVGVKTFGKGIVQVILAMDDGSALKVTTSRYFLPSGVCIHELGIEPHVEIEDDPETEEDEQLNKAIEILLEKITE